MAVAFALHPVGRNPIVISDPNALARGKGSDGNSRVRRLWDWSGSIENVSFELLRRRLRDRPGCVDRSRVPCNRHATKDF